MAPANPKRTIIEFVRDKKRATCPVCTLPLAAREQLLIAREKDIKIEDRRNFIKAEYGVALTSSDFSSHQSGHHDDK